MRGQAFGLEKDLVAGFAGKAVDLVLDGRAIPGTDALDHAREHGGAVECRADDLVSALVGVCDPARQLRRVHAALAEEREHRLRRIAWLHFHHAEVDAAAIDPRRGAGLEPADRQLQFSQPCGKGRGRRLPGTAGGVAPEADVDQAGKESPGGQHDGARPKFDAQLRAHADHAPALDQDVVYGLLEEQQVGLALEPPADRVPIKHAVGLRARRPHGGTLGSVQNAELNAGLVGGKGHRTAKGIHFLHQVTLADPADRWIARHLPQRLDAVRQEQRAPSHARRSKGSLGAGVAATDDDDVEILGRLHGEANFTRALFGSGSQRTVSRGTRYLLHCSSRPWSRFRPIGACSPRGSCAISLPLRS